MKLQLASDLHLEFLATKFPTETLIQPVPGADLLVLAGDIQNGTKALERVPPARLLEPRYFC
jgi:predicted phosphodiesterase